MFTTLRLQCTNINMRAFFHHLIFPFQISIRNRGTKVCASETRRETESKQNKSYMWAGMLVLRIWRLKGRAHEHWTSRDATCWMPLKCVLSCWIRNMFGLSSCARVGPLLPLDFISFVSLFEWQCGRARHHQPILLIYSIFIMKYWMRTATNSEHWQSWHRIQARHSEKKIHLPCCFSTYISAVAQESFHSIFSFNYSNGWRDFHVFKEKQNKNKNKIHLELQPRLSVCKRWK